MTGLALRARRMGIDTYTEPVVFLRADSPVTRSEGFEARAQVEVRSNGQRIGAVLMVVTSAALLQTDEAGLSESAWRALKTVEGATVQIVHLSPASSFSHVRSKIFGHRLDQAALDEILADIVQGRYADVHLAAFITACAGSRLDVEEMVALTRSMVATGEVLEWGEGPIVDKHCVGGLPGNRTTPIVVPIVAAAGLRIPKTSSRAITSPAGTADTMEVLAPVDLSLDQMRRVVEADGGCVVWGGAMRLAPVDDMLIRVEHPLNLDSEGQMVASILAKKLAAGSTHVVLDIPVGPSAKVRSDEAAALLARDVTQVAEALEIHLEVCLTDGTQPVGRGVGPSAEAVDVLAVLRREQDAPLDLEDRAVQLAGRILEMGGASMEGQGVGDAREILHSGAAWTRFHRICESQGGFREPVEPPLTWPIRATRAGVVRAFDNRRLASAAKYAGAPADRAAGLRLRVKVGDRVEVGQPLFVMHAESPGELDYALEYLAANTDIVDIGDPA